MSTTVSDALGGLLVGLLAAAITRYVLGTTAGLPSTNRISGGLADLNVHTTDLHYLDEQPPTSILLIGTSADGIPLFVPTCSDATLECPALDPMVEGSLVSASRGPGRL